MSGRLERLEDVAAHARFALEKESEFYEREENEGRLHAVSPRVAYAKRDLLRALDRLDNPESEFPRVEPESTI